MDSPDVRQPHTGDPWHPSWAPDQPAGSESTPTDESSTTASEAAARILEIRDQLASDDQRRVFADGITEEQKRRAQVDLAQRSVARSGQFVPADDDDQDDALAAELVSMRHAVDAVVVGQQPETTTGEIAPDAVSSDVPPHVARPVAESTTEPLRSRFGRGRRRRSAGAAAGSGRGGSDDEEFQQVDSVDRGDNGETPDPPGDDDDFPWDDGDWARASSGEEVAIADVEPTAPVADVEDGAQSDDTLEFEVSAPRQLLEDEPEDDEGRFSHAEVIPLIRRPEMSEEDATAGLDPDLLATAADADGATEQANAEPAIEPAGDDAASDESPQDTTKSARSDSDDEPFGDITLESFSGAVTEEYAELARSMQASEGEDHQPAAVSAEMPGIDTSLVSLDDVVDAGLGVNETISTTPRSDLGLRIATGLGLMAVFLGSLRFPWAIGGLMLVVLSIAALELYIVSVNAGYRPLTWAGLVGVIGALVGTWVWGVVAVPIALGLTMIGATLFLALSAQRRTPLLDLALTIGAMAWIGVLGAPAFDIIQAAEFRWLIFAVVFTTAVMDVAQYFVGRALGRRPLAPVVSPKKTIEGLVGGVFAAALVGAVFGTIQSSPFSLESGLAFGVMVGIVAPFGDLAVSVVKRALNVKDMGGILPGHGGVLDRVDAIIFVIPSAWVLYRFFDLLG